MALYCVTVTSVTVSNFSCITCGVMELRPDGQGRRCLRPDDRGRRAEVHYITSNTISYWFEAAKWPKISFSPLLVRACKSFMCLASTIRGIKWILYSRYLQLGEDCWSQCNRKEGRCSYCGSKGMCCRKDEVKDPNSGNWFIGKTFGLKNASEFQFDSKTLIWKKRFLHTDLSKLGEHSQDCEEYFFSNQFRKCDSSFPSDKTKATFQSKPQSQQFPHWIAIQGASTAWAKMADTPAPRGAYQMRLEFWVEYLTLRIRAGMHSIVSFCFTFLSP